ncbi:putative phage associated protein [Neisseria meningitidis]|nr:putative phage associated protein [Neisseria meningitidis]
MNRHSHTLRHSRENGNLEPQNFQTTFEYFRRPMVWIPTFVGMTIWKLPETQKQPKPNTLDSRLRGKDGRGWTMLSEA